MVRGRNSGLMALLMKGIMSTIARMGMANSLFLMDLFILANLVMIK